MVPHEMPKESFLQSMDVMEQLAKQAKDWLLFGWIRFYRRHPSTIVTKWVAHVLHHSIHFGFVKTLTETIKRRRPSIRDACSEKAERNGWHCA